MSALHCTTCHWTDVDATSANLSDCPQCGARLHDHGQSFAPPEKDDDALVAQLREAFGPGSRGVGGRTIHISASPRTATRTESLPPGSRLADFEILAEIGRGGMGVVYKARQVSLDRPVALKVMTGTRRFGPTAAERFHREARAAARLNHVNVVPVYAQGAVNDIHYYAMKLVEGVSLDTAIQSRPELLSSTHHITASSQRAVDKLGTLPPRSPLSSPTNAAAMPATPPAESKPQPTRRTQKDYRYMASLLAGAAEGLAHAHLHGVIHRDIKPHNLILGDDLQLHLTDFGLAFLAEESHLTLSGEVMGTPAYLSPEQVRGDLAQIDHRTDIYSLGVTLYEMVTSHRPFEFESRDQVLHGVASLEPQAPRKWDPAIPRDLETICLRAINKEPHKRYPSAAALADDLRRFAEGRPITTRRASLFERATKWTRRHRGATAAIIAAAAVFFVGAGWSLSVAAAHRRESAELLRGAYNKLVYEDFQACSEVSSQIQAAASLRGDAQRLNLLHALCDLGQSDNAAAVRRLHEVTAVDPLNRDFQYLLAWAMYRDRQRDEAVALANRADQSGGPHSADGWFFRGMAINQWNADEAIQSHRQAVAVRAAAGDFFPQAGLHLGRALNQQMYSSRTTDGLKEAERIFTQLSDAGYYKSRPDYLLSIAYRLAGEVFRDSSGARIGESEKHFDLAIQAALKGMEKEPTSDRPYTAKAECLEQLGRFDEAIVARTEALQRATSLSAKCEALHYRWRLRYWTGDYDGALADLDEYDNHRRAMKENAERVIDPWHQHVYRALIAADRGDLAGARAHALAIQQDDPADPAALTLSFALRRALGQADPSDALEAMFTEPIWQDPSIDAHSVPGWRRALLNFLAGKTGPDVLQTLATGASQPFRLLAEADFYQALGSLGNGDRVKAISHFANSHQSFDSEAAFSYHARVFLQQLMMDPDWPHWLPALKVGGRAAPAGSHTSP